MTTIPSTPARLQARVEVLEEAAGIVAIAASKALRVAKDNDFIFDGNGGQWEKLAFTYYSALVELTALAKEALDEEKPPRMMASRVEFTVSGEPHGKERPRVTSRGAYTPGSTRAKEEEIGWAAMPHFHEPLTCPVVLTVTAIFGVPKSWSKARKTQALVGMVHPTGRPDWDNCGKLVSDALNGIAWVDDAQVVYATVSKRYGAEPMIVVEVMALTTAEQATPSRFPRQWPS